MSRAVKILHHGAVKGGTGSCHELRLDDLAIDFDIGHIKALVVTHVHIDHVGRIPYLLGEGIATCFISKVG